MSEACASGSGGSDGGSRCRIPCALDILTRSAVLPVTTILLQAQQWPNRSAV
jgi:hypothetical protein